MNVQSVKVGIGAYESYITKYGKLGFVFYEVVITGVPEADISLWCVVDLDAEGRFGLLYIPKRCTVQTK